MNGSTPRSMRRSPGRSVPRPTRSCCGSRRRCVPRFQRACSAAWTRLCLRAGAARAVAGAAGRRGVGPAVRVPGPRQPGGRPLGLTQRAHPLQRPPVLRERAGAGRGRAAGRRRGAAAALARPGGDGRDAAGRGVRDPRHPRDHRVRVGRGAAPEPGCGRARAAGGVVAVPALQPGVLARRQGVTDTLVRGRARILMLAVGVPYLLTGAWAMLWPRGWFDDYPGIGPDLVAAEPPFNAHLATDAGAGLFAAGIALICAAVIGRRQAAVVGASTALAFGVPHLVFHLTHREHGLSTAGNLFSDALLIGAVVLVLVALVWTRVAPPRH